MSLETVQCLRTYIYAHTHTHMHARVRVPAHTGSHTAHTGSDTHKQTDSAKLNLHTIEEQNQLSRRD